jgi:hypothetical protein
MPQRKSTGLVNYIAASGSARQALSNGRIFVYTGTQPATADSAITGTLLATLTKSGAAFTAETLPKWEFTLAGTSGSLTSVKIGGVECLGSTIAFTSTLDNTATLAAASITNTFTSPDYTATAAGAVVTITGPVGVGASLNTLTVATTVSGGDLTATPAAAGAATVAGITSLNGCNFQFPAVDGVLTKETENWSGVAAATGTAGWFRYMADAADTTGVSTVFRRLDGSIATSGAEMNLSSTAVTAGGTFTINSSSFTLDK